jgi:hypothetical protein
LLGDFRDVVLTYVPVKSRMHMMYLIGLEINGAQGAKAVLEGHGVSIILKSMDVKFKVCIKYKPQHQVAELNVMTAPGYVSR